MWLRVLENAYSIYLKKMYLLLIAIVFVLPRVQIFFIISVCFVPMAHI